MNRPRSEERYLSSPTATLRHRNVLCRRYTLPERSPRGIVLPEAFRGDRTQTLFEVDAVGPCAILPCAGCRMDHPDWHGLGARLRKDDIIVIVGWTAVPAPNSLGADRWLVDARHIRAAHLMGG